MGDSPVSFGDSPNEMGGSDKLEGIVAACLRRAAIPSGESPDGTGW
jgi:hypothetical protein